MVHLIWFLIGILTFPTHLAQFIPHLKRKSPPPFDIYIASLLTNTGIALLVGIIETNIDDRLVEFIVYLVGGINIYIMGVLFSFIGCCCCSGYNDHTELHEELYAGFDDHDSFNEKIANNRSFPPNILIVGEAYHYETRTRSYYDSDGRLCYEYYQELIVTYRNMFQFKYESWQEEGNPITLTEDTSIIHGYIYCDFKFDDESINIINQIRQVAYNDACSHDAFVSVYNKFIVPGMNDKICGTTRSIGKKNPCVTKWIPTCGGRCLIFFLKFLGYSSLVYSCWTSTGIYLKMNLVKNISMKPKNDGGLRCDFMEPDKEALKTTFHFRDSKIEPEQPTFNDADFQTNFDSLYKTNSNVVSGYNNQGGLNITNGANEIGYGNVVQPDPNEAFQRMVEVSPYLNNVEEPQNLEKIDENKDHSDLSISNSDEENK